MSDRMSDEEQEAAYGDKCPKCRTEWTKTQRNIGGHWFHCVPCNKKAEDLQDTKASSSDKKQLDMFDEVDWGEGWDDWKVFTKEFNPSLKKSGTFIIMGTPVGESYIGCDEAWEEDKTVWQRFILGKWVEDE